MIVTKFGQNRENILQFAMPTPSSEIQYKRRLKAHLAP
jgi:hypothetical protein